MSTTAKIFIVSVEGDASTPQGTNVSLAELREAMSSPAFQSSPRRGRGDGGTPLFRIK